MFKYADDTYVVIPGCNALSRDAELDNVAKWAVTNNLQLNRVKSVEIIFENRRYAGLSPAIHRRCLTSEE